MYFSVVLNMKIKPVFVFHKKGFVDINASHNDFRNEKLNIKFKFDEFLFQRCLEYVGQLLRIYREKKPKFSLLHKLATRCHLQF